MPRQISQGKGKYQNEKPIGGEPHPLSEMGL